MSAKFNLIAVNLLLCGTENGVQAVNHRCILKMNGGDATV